MPHVQRLQRDPHLPGKANRRQHPYLPSQSPAQRSARIGRRDRSAPSAKKIGPSVALLLSMALLSPGSLARAAEAAGDFLNLGFGARSLGLGGALTASADGPEAIYWNPAKLAFSSDQELLAMHAERFAGTVHHENLALILPNHSRNGGQGALGIALIRVAVPDIPRTDRLTWLDHGPDGAPNTGDEGEGDGRWNPGERVIYDPDKLRYETDAQNALLLSYGMHLTDRLAAGVTAKMIRQSVGGISSFGTGLDLGFIYRPWSRYVLGLRLGDVGGTQIWWDSGRRERVRTSLWIGLAYGIPAPSLRGEFLVTFDGRANEVATRGSRGFDSDLLSFGTEFTYRHVVSARWGLRDEGFTAGAGLAYGSLGIDYAYAGHSDLGDTQRVALQWRFSG